MSGVETPEIGARDVQTDAEPAVRHPVLARQGQARCQATTAAGKACQMPPLIGTRFCHSHTPGLAAEAGRRGGLNRRRKPIPTPRPPAARVAPDSPVAKLPDVKIESAEDARALLVETMNQLRRGEIDVQVGNALLRMIQTASKVVVQVDLERRLAAIEAAGAPK